MDAKIEERPASEIGGGIGYGEAQGFMLNGKYIDANMLGTGDRIALSFNAGSYSKLYSISQTDPYFTVDGISRTLNLSYSDIRRLTSTYSTFSTKTYLAGTEFGYPVSEWQVIRLGSWSSTWSSRRHRAVRSNFRTGCRQQRHQTYFRNISR